MFFSTEYSVEFYSEPFFYFFRIASLILDANFNAVILCLSSLLTASCFKQQQNTTFRCNGMKKALLCLLDDLRIRDRDNELNTSEANLRSFSDSRHSDAQSG